jgi:hypothetical protein
MACQSLQRDFGFGEKCERETRNMDHLRLSADPGIMRNKEKLNHNHHDAQLETSQLSSEVGESHPHPSGDLSTSAHRARSVRRGSVHCARSRSIRTANRLSIRRVLRVRLRRFLQTLQVWCLPL